MTCCGSRFTSATSRQRTQGRPSASVFEYQGHGPLTLFGRATGIRYHFPGPGARVPVDPRDAPAFEVIRGLTIVQSVDRSPAIEGGV
jgi:hypothetical protein